MKRQFLILGAFSGALTLGLAGGLLIAPRLGLGASAQAAEVTSDDDLAARGVVETQAQLERAAGPIEVNDAGETFGSMLGRETLESAPDLVEVYGDSGKLGYVNKEYLLPEMPATPEEAAALTTFAQARPVTIPVYAEDGVTQIDTFTLQVPEVDEK